MKHLVVTLTLGLAFVLPTMACKVEPRHEEPRPSSPVEPVAETPYRLVLEGRDGIGKGKHIVLISGDEEYRSEEAMPMLAKILSRRHGFDCTVLFSWDKEGKYIDPNNQAGLRDLEALKKADLMIIATRLRNPEPGEARHISDFLNAGKPLIGLRTATHGFKGNGKFGPNLTFNDFGLKILGEKWAGHHGKHKRQGTRGVIEKANADHPILRSVKDIFAPSDVYGVKRLTEADTILLRGAVTKGLNPKSKAIRGKKNRPMQPLAWLHPYTAPNGKTRGTSFCTTAGASVDLVSEDLRRIIVNAACHLTGLAVPARANVDLVDPFHPSFYGFWRNNTHWKKQDMQPSDYALGQSPQLPDPPKSPKWNFRDRD